MDCNKRNILDLLSRKSTLGPDVHFADYGCDDGAWTELCAKSINATHITGVDIVEERLKEARTRNIQTLRADLDDVLPVPDDSFDVIHTNQVIEHVSDLDSFAREIYRTLKPGGIAVVSTENASSWCNVFAQALGWQMFSLTNMSTVRNGIGNPLALHRGEIGNVSSWTHKTIFSYRGLIEFFDAHGFVVELALGAGYFPLPAIFGKWDSRHGHFLSILVTKPGVAC